MRCMMPRCGLRGCGLRGNAWAAIGAAVLGFAAMLLAAPAPSAAASYTLGFTGTVATADGVFSTLGVATGDPVSGTIAIDPFNTGSYSTPNAMTHDFAQSSVSFSVNVSHPGALDLTLTRNGHGTVESGTATGPTKSGVHFDLQSTDSNLQVIYYTNGGSGTLLNSLAALPTTISSSTLIALLGGGSPVGLGVFTLGSDTLAFNISLATTPIPATLPLFVSALGGLGFIGWRRRRGRAAA